MYNPLTHKTPYGASAKNKEIKIQFPLECNLSVKRVFVVLRKDGDLERVLRYELPLKGIDTRTGEAVFEGAFSLKESGIWRYRFEGELENGELAFFGRGFDGCAVRGDWLAEWQLTVTDIDYKTPDWAKQGVIYQIFVDRFCKQGNRAFNKKGRLHENWDEIPDVETEGEDYLANDFFGGDAEGIISKLGYIKSLGVSCIYLSPIFEASSNHRYDTGDYLKIDSLFGDEKAFADLVQAAKKLGINVILDGVFNHTGADSVYFNKFGSYDSVGAYQSENSPYYGWYYFYDFPDGYDCWWGSTVVPTVNKSAEGWKNLINGAGGVIEKWTSFGIKGWRLDVVDELPIDFTNELCAKIKECDGDALIVGEVWEDASVKTSYGLWRPYFMGRQLDSVMNYPFKEAVLDFVCGWDKDKFVESVSLILENYPKQSLDTLMNLISSHDTERALTRLSGVSAPLSKKERSSFRLDKNLYATAKYRLKAAALLQFTLPGVPCVYYGDEAGMQGFEDPMNRGTYPWSAEDAELVSYYRKLGEMRADNAEILKGCTVFVSDAELLVYRRVSPVGTLSVYANPTDREIARDVSGVNALTKEAAAGLVMPPHSVTAIIEG